MGRTVIVQELLDEVYVCEDHTATAVPLQLQLVKRISAKDGEQRVQREDERRADGPFGDVVGEKLEVGVPLVADNLSAREAPHRNNLSQSEHR